MNNSPVNFTSIRQPAPSVSGTQKERVYNAPNVGVLTVPTISTTPMADTMVLKKQENPRMAYKLTPKSNKGFKLQAFLSSGIVVCSIGALFKVLMKTKK